MKPGYLATFREPAVSTHDLLSALSSNETGVCFATSVWRLSFAGSIVRVERERRGNGDRTNERGRGSVMYKVVHEWEARCYAHADVVVVCMRERDAWATYEKTDEGSLLLGNVGVQKLPAANTLFVGKAGIRGEMRILRRDVV